MSFEFIFLWRGFRPMYRNMWNTYRQIQFSWFFIFIIIEKKWMRNEERDQIKKTRIRMRADGKI